MDPVDGIAILLTLLDRASQWGAVVKRAQDEGRAITEEEIDAFAESAAVSDAELAAAISKARAEGR